MASKITARQNQSMQDLVLMACGTLDGAMAFCHANGLSISDVPVVGHTYIVPDDIARNKKVLRDLQLNGTVIGTLNQDPAPVFPPVTGRRTLLDPRTSFVAGNNIGGGWHLIMADDGMFTNYYMLMTAFDSPLNTLHFAFKTDYELGLPPTNKNANGATPPAKLLRWDSTTMMSGGFYLFWSDLPVAVITSTWRDVMGNTAIYAPLVVLKATYEIAGLIPWIDVIVEAMLPTAILFRITWVHPAIPFAQFHVTGFDWLGAALGGTPVSGVPNCVNITLPVGVYTLGAVTHYANSDLSVTWPDSYKTMVIEVY